MPNRRGGWAILGAAVLAGCAGRGKPALEAPAAEPKSTPPPTSAARPQTSSSAPLSHARISPARPDPGYDLAPVPVRITDPEYPAAARERGVRGTVLIEFVIDVSGRVSAARVLESVPELDAAAIACVKSWLFKPALRAGKPVETTARAPLRF